MGKESFLLYKTFYEPVKSLSLEDKGALFEAIYNYQLSATEPPVSSPVYMAFLFFKNQFRLDEMKYKDTCNANKTNAKKRWNIKNAGASARKRKDADNAYNDNDKENEKGNDKENENEIGKDKEPLHPLQVFVKTLREVSRIKTQLTLADCEKLITQYGQELVQDILLAMENTKGIAGKYTSVYLTLNNWAQRRKLTARGTDPGAANINRPYKPITADQL